MKLLLAILIVLPVEGASSTRKLSESLRASWCNDGGYAQYKNGALISGEACSDETYCCHGDEACVDFTGTICHGNVTHPNCNGFHSCRDANITLVKGGSCVNGNSCYRASVGKVEENSCVGPMSCWHSQINLITDSSCIGYQACGHSHLREVEKESCIGNRVCRHIDNANLRISDQSCKGTESCQETRIQDIIQNGSCRGNHTCDSDVIASNVNAGVFHFPQGHKCDKEYCSCLIPSTGTTYDEVKSDCPRFQKVHVDTSIHKDSSVANIPDFSGIRECFDNVEHSWMYLCGGGSQVNSHHQFNCNYFTMYNPENYSDIWAFYSTDGLNIPPFCSEVDLSFLPSEPSAQPSEVPTSTKVPSIAPSVNPTHSSSEIPTFRVSSSPSLQSSDGARFHCISWTVLQLVTLLICMLYL